MKELSELIEQFTKSIYKRDAAFVKSIENPMGLNVYRDSIQGAREKMLVSIFPCCQHLVGDSYFLALSKKFLAQTNQTEPDLGLMAAHFSHFLRQFEPVQQQLPYLADVAELEWAWQLLSTKPAMKVQSANLTPKSMFRTAVHKIIVSDHNIQKIWLAYQNRDEGNIDISEPVVMLVWRQADGVVARTISLIEQQVLANVDCAFEQLIDKLNYPPEQVGAAVAKFIQSGVLHVSCMS